MNNPIETLGYVAATCDLCAAHASTSKKRHDLERRAEKYREMQLAELENSQLQNYQIRN